MIMTLDEIVADIIKNNPNIRNELDDLENSYDFMHRRELIVEFPRWVRNHYKLWEADLAGEHPDDFSAKVVRKLRFNK
jgi:hypothetical protein